MNEQATALLDPGERRALLRHLLRQQRRQRSAVAPRGPECGPESGPMPLSFGQERIWLFESLIPGTATYHSVATLRIHGAVDVQALAFAVTSVVARHESLRTLYGEDAGRPWQRVLPEAAVMLQILDLREVDADRQAQALQTQLREVASKPFDLRREPLLRATLATLAPEQHALQLVVHHIAADGWSLGVILDDLAAAYADGTGGTRAAEPPRVPYVAFARAQRERLSGDHLDGLLSFWRNRLARAPAVLQLPIRPSPPKRTYRTAGVPVRIPSEVLGRIEALAVSSGATPFMVLLAAFRLLLRRYSGQTDILVGTQVGSRPDVALERVVGFFVNTLVLRGSVDDHESFHALLARVRDETLDAFAHQQAPFERVVDTVSPQRDLRRSVLVQANFNLQNNRVEAPRLPGLHVELEMAGGNTDVDLDLYLQPERDALHGVLQFQEDLFDLRTIQRMARQFEALVAALTSRPAMPVGRHPLLVAQEREQVIEHWNATRSVFDADRPVFLDIVRRAEEAPERVALRFGAREWTYRSLRQRVRSLASRLRALGVGRGDIVGMCLPRSDDTVIAMLGILEAGAAYLPLDPGYPADRLVYMLEDSRARVVVTSGSYADGLPVEGRQVLRLDTLADADADDGFPVVVGPDDLAYVLYTSGSTGRPKGVQISHCNLVSFLTAMRQRPGFAASDILLGVTSPSFDIAGLEIYLPLVCGAQLVIAGAEAATDGTVLAALLDSAGATCMQATPSTWRMLIDSGWQGRAGLRALCGGEALPQTLADALGARCASLWNMYGPTETTIWSTCDQVLPDEPVTLGRPIANTRAYVLDPALQPSPVSAPGRLFIGGPGVARGYLGRPALTAERFVPDPFASTPGSRMYDTGDLVRWREDGRLEFLGRDDGQVKVRGFRIELGELEAVLRDHPSINEAVVVARSSASGETALHGFVTARSGAEIQLDGVRAHVKQRLPDYMVPARLAVLEALPLTPNGKIDRKALPEIEPGAAAEVGHLSPRNETEATLARIWADVLGVERVGVDDNFFAIGGHSLLATRVAFRIRESLKVDVGAMAVFEHPTIAELATIIPAPNSPADRAAEVANMSDGEVEAMLQALIVAGGGKSSS